jgi:hypothetical protein
MIGSDKTLLGYCVNIEIFGVPVYFFSPKNTIMTISISEIHQISSHLLGVLARVIKLGDHENFCETYM